MQITTVGVEFPPIFNLGNYESLELGINLYAKVDPDEEADAVAEYLWEKAKASVKAQAIPVLKGINYKPQVQYKVAGETMVIDEDADF